MNTEFATASMDSTSMLAVWLAAAAAFFVAAAIVAVVARSRRPAAPRRGGKKASVRRCHGFGAEIGRDGPRPAVLRTDATREGLYTVVLAELDRLEGDGVTGEVSLRIGALGHDGTTAILRTTIHKPVRLPIPQLRRRIHRYRSDHTRRRRARKTEIVHARRAAHRQDTSR